LLSNAFWKVESDARAAEAVLSAT